MTNSKILKVLTIARNIVLVNALWVLFSIPVITAGASTCAAFYLYLKLINDENTPLWKNFVKGFKSSFIQGTLFWILTCIVSCGLFFIWKSAIKADSVIIVIGAAIISLIIVVLFLYTFPLVARYNNTIKNIFRNSLGMSFTYLPKTVCIIIIAAAFYVVFSWSIYTVIAGVFFVPGLFIYIMSRYVMVMFTQMELHQKTVEEEAAAAELEQDDEVSDEDSE